MSREEFIERFLKMWEIEGVHPDDPYFEVAEEQERPEDFAGQTWHDVESCGCVLVDPKKSVVVGREELVQVTEAQIQCLMYAIEWIKNQGEKGVNNSIAGKFRVVSNLTIMAKDLESMLDKVTR